jgi:glycosyltransferase involved in cell wall biosynthesis
MFVTVLISSRDRAAGLHRTLESLLCPANFGVPDWEVLVINDGSVDNTDDVCRQFVKDFPSHFRFLTQENRGKSRALNRGIAAARGDILAVIDDDVVCAPDYIQGIRNVFGRYDISGAQGRVLLDCEGGLPEWISDQQKAFVGLCDRGEDVKPWNYSLLGLNMVVRADAARAVGGFAPELGPKGAGFCEDTEFSLRLLKAGFKFVYAPQILVRHQLPRQRLTRSFFRRRYFDLGRSDAYRMPLEVPLWRFGLYVVKNWAAQEAEAARHRYAGRPAEALDCQCEARLQAGFFIQHWRFRRGVPRQLSRVTSWPDETPNIGITQPS